MIRKSKRITKYKRRPRDFGYMGWIRSLACVCCGTREMVEAAHVGDAYTLSKTRAGYRKCSDRETIPLCHTCHFAGKTSLQGIDREHLIKDLNHAFELLTGGTIDTAATHNLPGRALLEDQE